MLPIKLFRLVFCLFRLNRNIKTLCSGIEAKQPKQTLCFGQCQNQFQFQFRLFRIETSFEGHPTLAGILFSSLFLKPRIFYSLASLLWLLSRVNILPSNRTETKIFFIFSRICEKRLFDEISRKFVSRKLNLLQSSTNQTLLLYSYV